MEIERGGATWKPRNIVARTKKKKEKKGVIRISGALMTVIKQLQTRLERWDDAVVPAAADSVGVTRPAAASLP